MTFTQISRLLSARAEEFCQTYLSAGKREGHEWLVGDCLNQPGRSLAVQLDGEKRGLWIDRANSADKGDLLSLLIRQNGDDKLRAADVARRFLGLPAFEPGRNGDGHREFDPLKFRHPDLGFPNAAWAYRDASGVIFAWNCRFNLPEVDPKTGKTKKEFRPLRPNPDWEHPKWFGFKSPLLKPLYGQDRLAKRPDAPVMFCQGEKKADAAQKIFPEYVGVSAMNGDISLAKGLVDLAPLLTRTTPLVLWPDNDPSGKESILYLKVRFPQAKLVNPPDTLPLKWDLADTCPEGVSLRGVLDAALNPAVPLKEGAPFRPLGISEDLFHYFTVAHGRIVSLRADQHTELNIHTFAPDSYWQERGDFFQPKSVKLDYKAIAKHLMSVCDAVGWFSPSRVRGRGVWMDQDRVVIHAGDQLYVDNAPTPLATFKSKFIYPHGDPMEVDLSAPLPVTESQKLHQISELLPWGDPNSSWMFAGFVFASLVEGCLLYRPNFWLWGEPDSGKSWTVEHIVKPAWGPFCIQMAGSSTEASYRQVGRHDALSFLIDEFETETDRAIVVARSVLNLMRQSTTDTNARIYRGSKDGHAVSFAIRSNFCFASIAPLPTGRADESRLTIAEMLKRPDQAPFEALKAIWRTSLSDPKWCRGLQARAIKYSREIVKAAALFSKAIQDRVGDSRTGQQLGALAAGAWLLNYDQVPTPQEISLWLDTLKLSDYKPPPEESEHQECLNHLLQARLRRDNNTSATVAFLLSCVFSPTNDDPDARKTLLDYGIRCDSLNAYFDVANRHRLLAELFHGTRWANKWHNHLSRIGTKIPPQRFRFTRSRAIRIFRESLATD